LAVGFLLQTWLYLSPIVYPSSLVPEPWRALYLLNPMANVIEGFRWALLGKGRGPDLYLLISAVLVLVLLVCGAYLFRRTEKTIVDLI
jgi:lipopolysaccharide transport system permease protein